MKHKLLLLLIAFNSLLSAQIAPSFAFNNRDDINTNLVDSGVKPIYWNNGILTLGFCLDSTWSKEGMTLSFHDTLGNLNWKKIYYSSAYPYLQGNDIIAFNNSSFYVGGVCYRDAATSYDTFFSKFDMNGDSVYYKFYSDSTSTWLHNFEKFKNDTILVLNSWQLHDTDLYCKINVQKIDTFGTIYSSMMETSALKYPDKVFYDGTKIYVGGTRRTSPSSSYNVQVFINIYDENLNMIYYSNPSLTGNEYFIAFNLWNNLVYVSSDVTVYDPPNPNSQYQCRVAQLHWSAGYYEFTNNFGPISLFPPGMGQPVLLNSNYLSIPVCTGDSPLENVIYFADSALNNICSTYLGWSSTNNQESNTIAILPSKKIAGTGYLFAADTTESQDHWNYLTENMFDFIQSNCTVGMEEPNSTNHSDYAAFPTIFNETIIVKCLNNCNEKFKMILLNSLGQTIQTQEGEYELIINTKELSNGMYYLQIESSKKHNNFKMIKSN